MTAARRAPLIVAGLVAAALAAALIVSNRSVTVEFRNAAQPSPTTAGVALSDVFASTPTTALVVDPPVSAPPTTAPVTTKAAPAATAGCPTGSVRFSSPEWTSNSSGLGSGFMFTISVTNKTTAPVIASSPTLRVVSGLIDYLTFPVSPQGKETLQPGESSTRSVLLPWDVSYGDLRVAGVDAPSTARWASPVPSGCPAPILS